MTDLGPSAFSGRRRGSEPTKKLVSLEDLVKLVREDAERTYAERVSQRIKAGLKARKLRLAAEKDSP